jgi:hypothetical protein
MKQKIIYSLCVVLAVLQVASCKKGFFDQVPNDRITMEDVFRTRLYSEQFLAAIYAAMPDESLISGYCLEGLSDDLDNSYDRPAQIQYCMYQMNLGNWNASSDYINFWDSCYKGIRSATYFMQHIGDNREMIDNGEFARIRQYRAEARFMRAYLSFVLLRQYGPIILPTDEPIPADAANDDPLMNLPRDPYDKCVDWICNELDLAAEDLPLHFTEQMENDYGRATKVACMAVKARLFLYAASPQFNGNPAYASVVNKDGTHLFSTSYDPKKWERAAMASKDLIDLNIFDLYKVYNEDGSYNPYLSVRDVFLDPWNVESIFYMTTHSNVNMHRHGSPRYWNGYESGGVTQQLVDEFEMANGKRITDPSSGYSETGLSTKDYSDPKTGWVYAPAGSFNMYVNREPRFYADVVFNGAYCLYNYQEDKYRWQLYHTGNDGNKVHDSPRTGYVRLKMVSPDYNAKLGKSVNIPFLLYRYAEVLLNYVESLNEYDPGNEDIVKYLNMIRERAGLPGVESGLSQEEMRERIRHERRVELCFEWRRYFDTRRWLIAPQTDGGPFYGMNMNGGTGFSEAQSKDFYVRTVFETRVFRNAYYLFPIPQSEINKDANIVQNPGW